MQVKIMYHLIAASKVRVSQHQQVLPGLHCAIRKLQASGRAFLDNIPNGSQGQDIHSTFSVQLPTQLEPAIHTQEPSMRALSTRIFSER
jgi:hypothetical protein